jgi:hypothetical protein
LERFVTAVHSDLQTWPELPIFGQPLPDGRTLRYFTAAVFVSLAVHASLAFLLLGVGAYRKAAEPAIPSTGKPLIVSLSRLAPVSHDEPDHETVPAVPLTSPPAESSRSADHKAEAESVVTSKNQEIPDAETPEDKALSTDDPLPADPKTAHSITHEAGMMPEPEAGAVFSLKGQRIPDSATAEGKSPAADGTSSIDLEAAYSVAREIGRNSMPESEAQSLRFESRTLYLKNHLGITKPVLPDCRTVYAKKGLLGIPSLLKDAITDSSDCEWKRKVGPEREGDRVKKGSAEFLHYQTNKLIFGEYAYPVDSGGALSW